MEIGEQCKVIYYWAGNCFTINPKKTQLVTDSDFAQLLKCLHRDTLLRERNPWEVNKEHNKR